MELKAAQREVDQWLGGAYWGPLSQLARLTEEVGELARELNEAFGEKPKRADEDPGDIVLELGDCLFVILSLANSLQLDMEDAFEKTMAKYRSRDADRWRSESSESNG